MVVVVSTFAPAASDDQDPDGEHGDGDAELNQLREGIESKRCRINSHPPQQP
jgi:hypothetical protein